jgi:hypothetical protein
MGTLADHRPQAQARGEGSGSPRFAKPMVELAPLTRARVSLFRFAMCLTPRVQRISQIFSRIHSCFPSTVVHLVVESWGCCARGADLPKRARIPSRWKYVILVLWRMSQTTENGYRRCSLDVKLLNLPDSPMAHHFLILQMFNFRPFLLLPTCCGYLSKHDHSHSDLAPDRFTVFRHPKSIGPRSQPALLHSLPDCRVVTLNLCLCSDLARV